MKRTLLAIMALAVLLTGCAKKTTELAPSPDGTYNTTGERLVLYHGEKEFPLSVTVDGAQQLENGVYWYYELSDFKDREWTEPFYLYDTKKLELTGERNFDRLGQKSSFATNGNWPLFLNPVHTEYSASNQEKVDPVLIALTEQQLAANKMEDTPAIITDIWTCDLDGDGAEERLFKACNYTLPAKKPKDDEMVQQEQVKSYSFLAYAKNDACQVLFGSFRTESSDETASSVVLAPFAYDESGGISQTVLYRSEDYRTLQELRPLICDLEGDGRWSLILYREGDYKSFIVFSFIGGNFTQQYEIIF